MYVSLQFNHSHQDIMVRELNRSHCVMFLFEFMLISACMVTVIVFFHNQSDHSIGIVKL